MEYYTLVHCGVGTHFYEAVALEALIIGSIATLILNPRVNYYHCMGTGQCNCAVMMM